MAAVTGETGEAGGEVGSGGGEGERFRPEEILASTTDHELWRLEVERVAPSLKITVKSEARDWRAHLEQMHQYR